MKVPVAGKYFPHKYFLYLKNNELKCVRISDLEITFSINQSDWWDFNWAHLHMNHNQYMYFVLKYVGGWITRVVLSENRMRQIPGLEKE